MFLRRQSFSTFIKLKTLRTRLKFMRNSVTLFILLFSQFKFCFFFVFGLFIFCSAHIQCNLQHSFFFAQEKKLCLDFIWLYATGIRLVSQWPFAFADCR